MKKIFILVGIVVLALGVTFMRMEKQFELVAVVAMDDLTDFSKFDNSEIFYEKEHMIQRFQTLPEIENVRIDRTKLIQVFDSLEYKDDYYVMCYGKQLKSISYRLFDYNFKRGMFKNIKTYLIPDKKHIYIYKLKRTTVLYDFVNG